ncbi:uncharacterized protein LOC135170740 [Diachasmimorpha longicaudata]|uniref:uncharacterized protein LOC135170740 n=1 Tax=Diachasmimorpha longicaudata TaxID=58733 RepID=UPI0030B8B5C9
MVSMFCGLLVAAGVIAAADARSVPEEPLSIVMGPNGSPMLLMRPKRQPTQPYPHKTMVFTGYYLPIRTDPGPLTGVFAQGDAVSGGSYLAGSSPSYQQSGAEPAEDPEVASAEAEASDSGDGDDQSYSGAGVSEDPQQEGPQQEEDIQPDGTEAPAPKKPIAPQNHSAKPPSKPRRPAKHNKKTIVPLDEAPEEVDEEEEEEDSEEEDPYKTDRRDKIPNLNNFFPMVFRFPSSYGHRESESNASPPGMITAIANSYSTGKGGVASSVATAYGGSPNGKKKRVKNSQD